MTNKEECIRNTISDYNKILNVISKAPQTYNSILQGCKDNKTMQQILRRRTKNLFKQNRIWKMRIPGTRFGVVLFCTPQHDYKILVADNTLTGVKVFYFYNYKDTDTHIILNDYWELQGKSFNKWTHKNDELKMAKYSLRGGVNRFWD